MDGRALSSSSSPATQIRSTIWLILVGHVLWPNCNISLTWISLTEWGFPSSATFCGWDFVCWKGFFYLFPPFFCAGEKWQDFPNLNFRDVFGRISLNKNPWVTKGTNCEKSFWSQITAQKPDDHPFINCTSLLRKWSWMTSNIHGGLKIPLRSFSRELYINPDYLGFMTITIGSFSTLAI